MTLHYTCYGEDIKECETLRKNTFGDLGPLVSYKYEKDVMCKEGYIQSLRVRIPAVMRRGNESVPSNVIDLTQMLDKKNKRNHMLFKIPDTELLVNH